MNEEDFKRILIKFSDNPEDVCFNKEEFLVGIDGEPVSGTLKMDETENLLCLEGDTLLPAKQWIGQRLGKLGILARSILEAIPEDKHLIATPATMHPITGDNKHYNDSVDQLSQEIENSAYFSTNVMYLTSEAGEGKTCIMNALARKHAKKFENGESSWLFVPIALSGRPFLRLDEIIIGTLVNFYRFKGYFIESFLELVRLKLIVLGLDGFEEMAIEGVEGDVISSLGNLLNGLDSRGTMIFATRKAYYNYMNLKSQAKLFDSFKEADVTFSELYLTRWGETQFTSLAKSFHFDESKIAEYYHRLVAGLKHDHPVLTRAVLARKLVEEIHAQEKDDNSIDQIISKFKSGNKNEIFSEFVEMLLRRESTKWVARDELAEPLLSVKQHKMVLMLLAEEMWRSNSERLKADVLISSTELVCESVNMPPISIGQCKNRILHHALIVSQKNELYAFCHEEFYLFFLGESIAHILINHDSILGIKKLLDKRIVPQLALQECCRLIVHNEEESNVIDLILNVSETIPINSCLSQNLCSILVPLLKKKESKTVINKLFCSSNVFTFTDIANVEFKNCIIEKIELAGNLLSNITFHSCNIFDAVLRPGKYETVVFDNDSLPQKLVVMLESDSEPRHYYDPKDIMGMLSRYKVKVKNNEDASSHNIPPEDTSIVVTFRVIQAFQRSTRLDEGILQKRLGSQWKLFKEKCFDSLVRMNILEEVNHAGQNKQKRFKLNVSFAILADARRQCNGKFENFVAYLSNELKH